MGVVFLRFIPTLFVIAFLLFFFSTAASLHGFLKPGGGFGQGRNETAGSGLTDRIIDQKRLGSAPPKCRSKCGTCEPCKAVHVQIQPGLIMPLDYYPEAWRCKCGNKIFLP